MSKASIKIVIVDYTLGNLFSVKNAFAAVGYQAEIIDNPERMQGAHGVVLPGVGAFADAMTVIRQRGFDRAIKDYIQSGKPFMGICLGMQLLLDESHEFGRHQGLAVFRGSVVKLMNPHFGERQLKVPQVGWNQLIKPKTCKWEDTPLHSTQDREYMYFGHSYYVQLENSALVLGRCRYGNCEFSSAIGTGQVFACQFHPERSGPAGLKIYHEFAKITERTAS